MGGLGSVMGWWERGVDGLLLVGEGAVVSKRGCNGRMLGLGF